MTSDFQKLIYQRLSGFDPSYRGRDFTSVIKGNVTPVPFFGDFRNSSIVTIAINPSTEEFSRNTPSPFEESLRKPRRSTVRKIDRGLVHLSDLGLSQNFFHEKLRIKNPEDINTILQGLIEYFDHDSYNAKWFGKVEPVLNDAFSASYFSSPTTKRACHLDISPWTTLKWSSTEVQKFRNELREENQAFFRAFLSESQYEYLMILGGDTRKILDKNPDIAFDKEREFVIPKTGPTFETGWLQISRSMKRRFFYNSFSPSAGQSVQSVLKTTDREKSTNEGFEDINRMFIRFIRDNISD